MKRVSMGLAALACAIAVPACGWAATYNVSTPTYGSVVNYSDCPSGVCANFTTVMAVSGTITFSALPANLPASTDLYPYVTSFALSDGLTTYNRTDPGARIFSVRGTTDGAGTLTALNQMVILKYSDNSAGPHSGSVLADAIISFANYSAHRLSCSAFTGPADPDTCTAFVSDPSQGSSRGVFSGPVAVAPAVPAIVPTLGEWAIMALAILLAGAGALTVRGRRSA